MATARERDLREAWDLVNRAVGLRRRGALRVSILAKLDQARSSLRREPNLEAHRLLLWVCNALDQRDADQPRIDLALGLAAREVIRPPVDGRRSAGPRSDTAA